MSKTVGFTLSIGARMASSVGSVFDTLAGRTGRLKKDARELRSISSAAGKLTFLGGRLADYRSQAARGLDVSKELAATERAFEAAKRAAAKYKIEVGNAAQTHAQATRQLQSTEAALKRQEALMRNAARRKELQGEIMGTVASAGMVVAPVKIAIDFESSMADAAKTIDGMRDEAGKLTPEYYKMEAAVKSLGRSLPLTHNELAALFAAGGQMGMTTAEQLTEFTTLSAHMAVAFGMGTQEAADAIGGYKTKLGLTNDEVREMLDLANQFANTSSATEKDIAGIVSRVGALGDMAGIAYKPMTAMAATLASMKVPEEIAATGLKNFMLALSKGDAATKQQKEAFARLDIDSKKLAIHMQKDAEGAMLKVLESIKALPKHEQTAMLTELFGTQSVGAIAPMLTQLDLLKQNFVQAADTAKYSGAMQKEFENRARTTANNLVITKNKMSELAITAGGVLLPALNDLLNAVGQGAVGLARFAEANPQVVSAVMYSVSALAAFKVASLAGGYGLTIVSNAWQLAKGAWAMGAALCNRSTYAMLFQRTAGMALATGTRVLTIAQTALNLAMSNNPIGWVIKGVAALAGGLAYLYNTCEPVRNALDWLWDGIKLGLKPIFSLLEAAWDKIKMVASGIRKVVSWFSSDEAHEVEAKSREEEQKAGPASPDLEPQPQSATKASLPPLASVMPAQQPDMPASLSGAVPPSLADSGLMPVQLAMPPALAASQPLDSPGLQNLGSALQRLAPLLESLLGRMQQLVEGLGKNPALLPASQPRQHPLQKSHAPLTPARESLSQAIARMQSRQPQSSGDAAACPQAAAGAAPVINPSLQLTINMDGVTDRDFAKRVLESLENNRSTVERFFGALFQDQRRLTYG